MARARFNFYHISKSIKKVTIAAKTLAQAKTEAQKKGYDNFYLHNLQTDQTRFYLVASFTTKWTWKSVLLKKKK